MSNLTQDERALYEGLWQSVDAYGEVAPGEFYLPIFLQCVGDVRGHVLDAGCGSGKASLALAKAGFRLTLCDLTDAGLTDTVREQPHVFPFHEACLWHPLRPLLPAGSCDWVYCTDVMEHIDPKFTMLVVEQMLRVARKGVFLGIATVPDSFGAWVGRPLHQTVDSFVGWREALSELGRVTDARDLLNCASFMVQR